jgi:hypothetical protein
MNCELCDIMRKNEEYARGWVRLFEGCRPSEAIQVAQYALDLQKLRHKHEMSHERVEK